MSESASRSTPVSRLLNTPVDNEEFSIHNPTRVAIGIVPKSPDVCHTRCSTRQDQSSRQSQFNRQSQFSRQSHRDDMKDGNAKQKCKTTTAENIMKKQYAILKEEYYRICQHEASLRNQMALLGAEIILMQTKAYHRCPADVRKINIDPITIRKVEHRFSRTGFIRNVILWEKYDEHFTGNSRFFNKNGKTQGIIPPYNSVENYRYGKKTTAKTIIEEKSQSSLEREKNVVHKCFYLDIPSPVVTPPYIPRGQEIVTRHRLPKLTLPKIENKCSVKCFH